MDHGTYLQNHNGGRAIKQDLAMPDENGEERFRGDGSP